MISQLKMTWLQLGVIAKAMILVSHLHPKGIITKADPDYSKSDKVEGLVVVSEGPKLIECEVKVAVVFCHPPKDQQAEELALLGSSSVCPHHRRGRRISTLQWTDWWW